MTENLNAELLALMLRRDFWQKYKTKILKGMFPAPLDKLYLTISNFHETYEEDLDKSKLWSIMKVDHPTLTEAQRIDLYELTQNIKECPTWSDGLAEKVLTSFWKKEVARQIIEQGVKLDQNTLTTLDGLQDIVEKHGENFIPKSNFTECTADIDDLLELEANMKKWNFNLPILQQKIGGMSAAQFLQIMARPDCGKTGKIVSLVAGPEGWALQGAKIDWYVNEEPVRRTRWRCMSSLTGLTKEKLIANKDAAKEIWSTISQNVRTFDIPFGTPIEQIALRTRDRRPDIVIIDQLDKCGVTPMAGNFSSETERIRLLYIKFRAMLIAYECLGVGVCQASADAEGKTIVTYDMAENSKTGKGAECDVFMGIGRKPLTPEAMEEDYMRYITISKNKLDTGWKGTIMCKLQPQISRFVP